MRKESRIRHHSLLFRYAKGKSLTDAPEIHPYHEILYFLGESATFLTKNEKLPLEKEVLLLIPKESYHQFEIPEQDLYERCVLNFSDIQELSELISSVMTDIRILPNPSPEIRSLFSRLIQSFSLPFSDAERELLLSAVFSELLLELKLCAKNTAYPIRTEHQNPIIAEALRWIEGNYHKQTTLHELAKTLRISPSSLSHAFAKDLGTSVYHYITEYRLIAAHNLISRGIPPTVAYLQCGWSDYSSFYRAYKKMFRTKPSETSF